MPETLLSPSNLTLFGRVIEDLEIADRSHNPSVIDPRPGANGLLERQLAADGARFARIYGFSYEGVYYDLPWPMLFLVHGDGEPVADEARAMIVGDPSLTGIATADFYFAEGLRSWSYDKADYTIRMDIETGMFEQVLLETVFGQGAGVSGGKVAGGKVAGGKVAGGKVAGGKVAGGKVYGPRWRDDATD